MNESLPRRLAAEAPLRPAAGTPRPAPHAPAGPNEAVIDAIFRTARTGIIVAGLDGRRIRVNAAFCEMTGHSEAELLALDFRTQVHPEDLSRSIAMRASRLAGERESYTVYRRFRRADGSWLSANATILMVRDGEGRPSFTVIVVDDLTEQLCSAQAVADIEDRYRATFNRAGVGITHMDASGRRLSVNDTFCAMLGYTSEAFLALPFDGLMHPDESDAIRLARDKVLRGEASSTTLERRYRCRDGHWIWGSVTTTVARSGDGTAYTIAIMRDITARRLAQEALVASEERFRATFEQAPFAIAHFLPGGRWLRVNRCFTGMFGYRMDELSGVGWHELNHPDEIPVRERNIRRLVDGDADTLTREKRYLRRGGIEFWGQVTISMVRARDGGIDYMVASIEDITARRRAADAMRESEARFRSLIEFSSDWYWEQDEQLRFTVMSGGAVASRDLVAEGLGRHLWELPWLPGANEAAWDAHKAQVARHEPFRELVLSRLAPDGTPRHVSISGEPVFDPQGTFRGYRGLSSDVTNRVVFERRLREREAENRLLAEIVGQSRDAIITRDLDNRIVTWNAGATLLFGHAPADAIGRNATELLALDPSPETIASRIERLRAGASTTRRSRNRSADGRSVDVEISVSPLRDAEGRLVGQITISRDLTARLETEQALLASEARNRLLAAVVDQTTEAIITKDLDNQVLTWNRGATALFGHSPEEAIGRNISTLVVPGADEERIAAAVADTRSGRTCSRFEARRARNGRTLDVEVSYSPLFSTEGAHIGEISIARDITSRLGAERSLRASEARSRLLAAVVEQSSEAIVIKDLDNIVLSWNPGAERMYGWSQADAVGRNITLLVRPEASGADVARRIAHLRRGVPGTWRIVSHRRDGTLIHADVNVSPLFDENGRHIGEITMMRDITERVQSEEALRDHRLFLEQAQEVGGIGSWALALTDQTLTWSDETKRIFGIGRDAFDGGADNFWSRVHPEDVARVRASKEQGVASRKPFTNEFRIIRPDGALRWIHENAAIICDDHDRPLRVVGVAQDITERRAAQERIEFLATRDPLTELPNRLLLHDRITHGMASAARSGTQLALLFIDLDRFKTINDSLGHRVGDELLKQVAERLGRCVRKEDTLARLGGDEFVVLLQGLNDSQAASQIARKVLALLARPYLIEGHQLSTSCSIGISLYPTDGADAQALMKNADAAMYHAKEHGRAHYHYFSADLHSRAVERLSIETALRRALDRDEFELHFQPQVRMDDSTVVGMEALLRWNHPEEGLLAPGRFIRIAEDSGLIVPLGEWALNAACAQMRAWLDAGLAPPRLAVNVSVGQLSRTFVRSVGLILQAHRIDGSQLELEMTESLLMQHVEENVKLLQRLGALGVQVALDDFGTGYSSLAYLKKFPIDALKIDRSFVRDIVEDPDDSAITAAVVAIGHHMKLRVVAEGVETCEQLAILRAMGCDEYQGYLFSRPLPVADFAARFLSARE